MKVTLAAFSRRAALTAVLAAVPLSNPIKVHAGQSALGGFGASECKTDVCRERIAATPTELETSPLIEELKRRTEKNAQKNAALIKEMTNGASGGQINDAAPDYYKSVRYDGLTRILNKEQVKALQSQGYELDCPKQAGFPCNLVEAPKAPPPPPPPPPTQPPSEELEAPGA